MKKMMITLLIPILLTSCNNEILFEKDKHELSILIASDLHLLSNNLISPTNEIYIKKNFTSDGRVAEFDYQLINSLIETINEKKPDFVVLTGDLTFNGELESHKEIVRLFTKVNDDSKVLVIPGNHDYFNIYASKFIDDKKSYTDTISDVDFKEIYADFGYNDALIKDENSLSYIYKMADNKWMLMLDGTLSKFNFDFGMNFIGGALSDSSLAWLEKNLKYAYENDIEVISATHHNLLVHNEMFYKNYTISGNDLILNLYKKYNVKINFSGHLHIQSIKSDDNIYDISNGSILDYGNRYGILDIYNNCYEYNSYKLVKSLPDDFEKYSFDTFYNNYFNKQVVSNERYYGEIGPIINDLNSKINAYYFDGNYEKIHQLIIKNHIYANKVLKNDDAKYMQNIYNVENKNQHNILIKK